MFTFKRLVLFSLLGWAGTAFAGPELDFSERPSYLSQDSISLTFDDGPDWTNTAKVLDILKQKNVKATFFINGENWSNINTEEPMRELVRRMVREGHTLANHTVHHNHLGELSNADVEKEIAGVENSVKSIFGATAPQLTLLRAPHGEPFQIPDGNYSRVSGIVAKHAVHIGWNIDSFDYNCAPGDGGCVYNNVTSRIKTPGTGAYGIVLMHSVHSQTANALPGLIDYIRNKGFKFVSVEDVVKARYGKSSAALIGVPNPNPNPNPGTGLPAAGKAYALIARHSNKCLDVKDHSVANGGALQQWSCAFSNNQKFTLIDGGNSTFFLQAVESRQCVDIAGVSTANGAAATQWPCHQGPNQRVTLTKSTNGSYTIRFAHSNKCLDVSGPSIADGAKVHQWECHGGSNQDWFFQQ